MKNPNFLIFFTDQQRWDTSKLHGNTEDLTPNYDFMARSGTHFFNAFTNQPVCGPARSIMQTGLYPTTSGCFRNQIPLKKNENTVAKILSKNGYNTGYIGKWHLANPENFGYVLKEERGGYDFWLAANMLEFVSDAYDTRLYNEKNEEVKLIGHRIDAITDEAIKYLKEFKNKNFFLFLSFLEPHHQNHLDAYIPPRGFKNRFQNAWIPVDLRSLGGSSYIHLDGYYGIVKKLDDALGRIYDALFSLNLLEDTILIYTSDHGNHFKTRNREYKRSPHDSNIRIPLAFHGREFTSCKEVHKLVSLVDIVPTILDVCEIDYSKNFEGETLRPLLFKNERKSENEIFVQISEDIIGRAIRTDRWKYCIVSSKGDPWTDGFSDEYEEYCLYDLENDPHELDNLVDYKSHENVLAELRKELIKKIKRIEGKQVKISYNKNKKQHNQLFPTDEFPYYPTYLKKFR